jgi:hypothetical protein
MYGTGVGTAITLAPITTMIQDEGAIKFSTTFRTVITKGVIMNTTRGVNFITAGATIMAAEVNPTAVRGKAYPNAIPSSEGFPKEVY